MYSACAFVYLGIRMQCTSAIFSSVACPALPYSSLLSNKRLEFQNTVIEHKTYVYISSPISS